MPKKTPSTQKPKCHVAQCANPAAYEVILYDVYTHDFMVFFERDLTCPFICPQHARENEKACPGPRTYRGDHDYPHTNRAQSQGFTIYRPLTADV